jgi:Fic family protein
MFSNPPSWQDSLDSDLLTKTVQSPELQNIIKKAQREYLYWDKFKHQKFPNTIKPQDAWAYLKIIRFSSREKTPVRSLLGGHFTYSLTNVLQEKLSYIDTYAGGLISSQDGDKPTEAQKTQFIMSGLSEEAIASSQIEGANTSRKVAKEMLLSKRPARNHSEQMIINNFKVMQRLLDWKDVELNQDMLFEIQSTIAQDTGIDQDAIGRLRKDSDEIIVGDGMSGEIVYTPPKEEIMILELQRLIEYANADDEKDEFVHPVIKATILHFWLAYLHPFVDGNGRTARAIFYWYLLKRDYWHFQYLSVSRAIKESRAQYDRAFLYTEHDDNDLTYFLHFITTSTKKAIVGFMAYFERKTKENEEAKKISKRIKKFNKRQVALLRYLDDHKKENVDIMTHKNKHGVTYETARTDLMGLSKMGYLRQIKQKNKYVFVPNTKMIKELLR